MKKRPQKSNHENKMLNTFLWVSLRQPLPYVDDLWLGDGQATLTQKNVCLFFEKKLREFKIPLEFSVLILKKIIIFIITLFKKKIIKNN